MDKTLHDRLTGWRRHLHANPELTLHETRTAAFVQACLGELDIPFVSGIGGNGVVATITRGRSNRCVGLRADMDALPIVETTGVAYASGNPGVMHACGHDGHTTSLLGAAALLAADTSWSGTVQFVFQPAEEGGGGAKAMIADGLFDRFPMERIFGYHNWPGLEAGTVAVHDGPVMAAGNRLWFTVTGHGGHAGLPHLTRDPMVASAHLLLALQSIVSRSVDPLDGRGGFNRNDAGRFGGEPDPRYGGHARHHAMLAERGRRAGRASDPPDRGGCRTQFWRRYRRADPARQSGHAEHPGRTGSRHSRLRPRRA